MMEDMLKKSVYKNIIPLYSQVESLMKNRILSGQYHLGEKLPSDEELLKQFGVSKITVRNALLRLEAERLIVRIRGKGTFVSEEIPARKRLIFTGSLRHIIEDGRAYQTEGVGIEKIKVGQTRIAKIVRDFFNLSNEDEICRIQRIRKLSEKPVCISENFVSRDSTELIKMDDLSNRSFLKMLEEKLKTRIVRGELYIEAVPAEPDIAELLQCQPFDPLALMQFYYWSPSDVPLAVANTFVRGDHFRYKVDLHW
jgi:GntR family transcriptional regulator